MSQEAFLAYETLKDISVYFSFLVTESVGVISESPLKKKFMQWDYLDAFARVVVTKYHRLGGLNNRNVFPYSSEAEV